MTDSARAAAVAGEAGQERPVTARSVIASVLLPLRRPELPGQALVRCGELFGIAEGTSRVALSRMVAAGELEVAGGVYRLAGPLLRRQARQQQGRLPRLREWDGRWVQAVVVAERRPAAERAALRTALRRMRLGELREGVWMRPDNLVDGPHAELDGATARHCLWLSAEARPGGAAAGRADDVLVRLLWDLPRWAAGADGVTRRLGEIRPRLEAGDVGALAAGFRVAAAAVRHLTNDPLLPGQLLPAGWPADRLRADYDRFETVYRQVLRRWLTDLTDAAAP